MPGMKQVFIQALSETSTVAKDTLGDIRWEGNKVYKYMQFNNGAGNIALLADAVVGYYLLDGYKNNVVTMDNSDMTGDVGAGVSQLVMADLDYGWFQIRGAATLAPALEAGTDGDPLTLVGVTDDVGTLDVNIATAANTHICARAGDHSDKEILCDFPF